jgi:hypothetical protein
VLEVHLRVDVEHDRAGALREIERLADAHRVDGEVTEVVKHLVQLLGGEPATIHAVADADLVRR